MLHASIWNMNMKTLFSQLRRVFALFLSLFVLRFELAKCRCDAHVHKLQTRRCTNENVAMRLIQKNAWDFEQIETAEHIFQLFHFHLLLIFMYIYFYVFHFAIYLYLYLARMHCKEMKKKIGSTRNTKVESVNFHLLLAQNLWMSKTVEQMK